MIRLIKKLLKAIFGDTKPPSPPAPARLTLDFRLPRNLISLFA